MIHLLTRLRVMIDASFVLVQGKKCTVFKHLYKKGAACLNAQGVQCSTTKRIDFLVQRFSNNTSHRARMNSKPRVAQVAGVRGTSIK